MNTYRRMLLLCLTLLATTICHAQDFQAGVEAARQGDYDTAYQIWSTLAEGGDPASQFNLAMMYVRGESLERDLSMAAQWFRKAAEQDQVSAQARLGALYAHGQGVQQDFGKAAKWLFKAARANHGPGQYDLAVLYANGSGVGQDYSEAYYWFTMSAINGFTPAQEAQKTLRQMLPPVQIGMVERRIQEELGLVPQTR